MNGLVTIMKAADAAAHWHINQRRKGAAQEPYIGHLLEVARLVAEATAGADPNLVVAALLHDTIEDQGVTREEIAAQFNDDVAGLVVEVTDDKKLPKAERKRLQIEHAANLTPRAKILKIADKISNLRSVTTSPPADWPMQRRATMWSGQAKLCKDCEEHPTYSNRNSIGLQHMLSGQFPWPAERRCRNASAWGRRAPAQIIFGPNKF